MNGGGLISSLQTSGHLENKYFLDQMSPSSIRRESVSAIDDFFDDFLGPPSGVDVNVNVNMKLMSRPHNATFGSNQHAIPPRQVPQVPVSDCGSNPNQQESSGSFMEELFGPCNDDISEKRLCNNNISKEPGMDVKPKFPSSELPMALEKMSDVWDLQELDAIEILDEAAKGSDSERTSSISNVDRSSSYSVTTPTHSNILSQMPPTSQGQLLPNGVHIKSEVDLTPVMSCNFQRSNVLSNNIPSVVKMEPCLPSYSASCTTVGKPTHGLLSSHNGVPNQTVRPNYLPLTSSNASIATSMTGIASAGSLKVSPAVSNSFTVIPSQGPANVPVVLQSIAFPPTPPDSQPSSPNQQQRREQQGQQDVRQTPPPPYPGVPILPATPVDVVTMGLVTSTGKPRQTHPGCTTIKYNRKNNPDLEKRRIHYCEFPGEYLNSLLILYSLTSF